MLDKNALKEKARKQFVGLMIDKVNWMAEDCYPCNLEGRFKEINEFLAAAKNLGVATQAQPFTEEEIESLVKELRPLRTLNMKNEAREILVDALLKKGFDSTEILESKPEK